MPKIEPDPISVAVAERLGFERVLDTPYWTRTGEFSHQRLYINFTEDPQGRPGAKVVKQGGATEEIAWQGFGVFATWREGCQDRRAQEAAARAPLGPYIDVEKGGFSEKRPPRLGPGKQELEQVLKDPAKTEKTEKTEKPKSIKITGVKPDGKTLIAIPAPEETIPKWGISMIKDKKTLELRPYINIRGLLWLGFQDEVKVSEIFTRPIQEGSKDNNNTWIFEAVVTCKRGTFKAQGDCRPRYDNDDAMRRMAETRAVARALRWATGAGTSAEELPQEYFEQSKGSK